MWPSQALKDEIYTADDLPSELNFSYLGYTPGTLTRSGTTYTGVTDYGDSSGDIDITLTLDDNRWLLEFDDLAIRSRCLIYYGGCICFSDSPLAFPIHTGVNFTGFVGNTVEDDIGTYDLDSLTITGSIGPITPGVNEVIGDWHGSDDDGAYFGDVVFSVTCDGLGIILVIGLTSGDGSGWTGGGYAGATYVYQASPCILNDPVPSILSVGGSIVFVGADSDVNETYHIEDSLESSYIVDEIDTVNRNGGTEFCIWAGERTIEDVEPTDPPRIWTVRYDSVICKWTLASVSLPTVYEVKSGTQDSPIGTYGLHSVS